VELYNLPDLEPIAKISVGYHDPNKIAFTPDGRRLVVTGDRGFQVWEIATGERLHVRNSRYAVGVAIHPDGRTLVIGMGDGRIEVWDLQTAPQEMSDPPIVLEGHTSGVHALRFSPDGTRLASGSNDTTIRLWDVETWQQVLELRGHVDYVYDLVFAPDMSRLVSASGDHTVRIWDTRPIRERRQARARTEGDEP
jgi:WD40 repeat protein